MTFGRHFWIVLGQPEDMPLFFFRAWPLERDGLWWGGGWSLGLGLMMVEYVSQPEASG